MKVFSSLPAWAAHRRALQGSLGLVPTMGYLHEGHTSLVRRSLAENDSTVVWIFVNARQFDASPDFAAYPRDMERDLRLLEELGTNLVLAPREDEVYPEGFQTYVTVEEVAGPLEGLHRPGHFRAVTTVVAKMLCLTQAHRAYFGQKDAQQNVVVRRMVGDLGIPAEIVVCPTVRESDGLALSSRNVNLSPPERMAATVLYRALREAEGAIACGEREGDALRARMGAVLAAEPLARVDYVSIADPDTLQECATVTGPVLASLAVHFGKTRLIDNISIAAAS